MLEEKIKQIIKTAIREVIAEQEDREEDTRICQQCGKTLEIQEFIKQSGDISRFCFDCRKRHNKKKKVF